MLKQFITFLMKCGCVDPFHFWNPPKQNFFKGVPKGRNKMRNLCRYLCARLLDIKKRNRC
jgi:hypothetical protein